MKSGEGGGDDDAVAGHVSRSCLVVAAVVDDGVVFVVAGADAGDC